MQRSHAFGDNRLSSLRSFVAVIIVVLSVRPTATGPQAGTQLALPAAWEIQAESAFGIVTAVVRCADILFLADANQRIRQYNLANGRLLGEVGAGRVGLPIAMTADCERRTLYVMTPTPMRGTGPLAQAFDLDSGELRREYALPPGFLPRPGGRVQGRLLVVAGIWAPVGRQILDTHSDRYYESRHVGLKLALETAASEPLLVPYETRCVGGGQCEDVRLDSVATPRGLLSVLSLPTSTSVGLYDGSNQTRVVSVKSDQFVRNGEVLDVNTPADARMRWTGRNSTIDAVFAFQDLIAVVHVLRKIGPDWHLGQPAPMSVFMNTYGWDGTQQQQDVRLPGRVIGRDDQAIYAIDYGSEGPRQDARKLRIVRIVISP